MKSISGNKFAKLLESKGWVLLRAKVVSNYYKVYFWISDLVKSFLEITLEKSTEIEFCFCCR